MAFPNANDETMTFPNVKNEIMAGLNANDETMAWLNVNDETMTFPNVKNEIMARLNANDKTITRLNANETIVYPNANIEIKDLSHFHYSIKNGLYLAVKGLNWTEPDNPPTFENLHTAFYLHSPLKGVYYNFRLCENTYTAEDCLLEDYDGPFPVTVRSLNLDPMVFTPKLPLFYTIHLKLGMLIQLASIEPPNEYPATILDPSETLVSFEDRSETLANFEDPNDYPASFEDPNGTPATTTAADDDDDDDDDDDFAKARLNHLRTWIENSKFSQIERFIEQAGDHVADRPSTRINLSRWTMLVVRYLARQGVLECPDTKELEEEVLELWWTLGQGAHPQVPVMTATKCRTPGSGKSAEMTAEETEREVLELWHELIRDIY